MSFEVSDRIKDAFQSVIHLQEVLDGLSFIKAEEDLQIKQQCELAAVEAPTGDEYERACWMAEQFKALGLESVCVDEFNNVQALRKGNGSGRRIVMEAHLDTVFPRGSVTKVPVVEEGIIRCPGIGDNTRGCITLLSLIRVLKEMQIETDADILFLGTAREEGIGGFGGMRDFMSKNSNVDAYLCIDGDGVGSVVAQATGIKTCEVNFYAQGGHANSGFGKLSNPLHAAARAVARIANLKVPTDPRTIFCVSNFHAGSLDGIHAIPTKATIRYNIRSASQDVLEWLDGTIKEIIQQACREEAELWGTDAVTFDHKYYIDSPAGALDVHEPIVEAVYETIQYFGIEPVFFQGGATNANLPICAGIPAVCLGIDRLDGDRRMKGIHTLSESFRIAGAYEGIQHAFLMMLLLAGVHGKLKSILDS